MTKTQQAIQYAIEKGYKYTSQLFGLDILIQNQKLNREIHLRFVLLDPLFFQALGKKLGWAIITCDNFGKGDVNCNPSWLYHQHRLIDWIAERKDIESFFAEIIK